MWWRDKGLGGRTLLAARGSISVLLLATGVWLAACAAPVQLKGTDLGKDPAPDFQLTDQNGNAVSLSGLKGKVVVLTFLYTRCPDECPLTAEHLRAAGQQLGTAMSQVTFVAVSVDPQNDTPDAVKAFNQAHGVSSLIYLLGTPAQLQPVWAAYYVAAQPDPLHPSLVSHSTRVVVIDKAGKQRVNMDSDFDPSDLVYNVQALLKE